MGALVQLIVDRRINKEVYSGPFSGGGSDFAEDVQKMLAQKVRNDVMEMLQQPEPPARHRIRHT